MTEWIPDALYRQLCDELLQNPLPPDFPPAKPAGPMQGGDRPGWFTPEVPSRLDGWCEDRDPGADLTDADGRE